MCNSKFERSCSWGGRWTETERGPIWAAQVEYAGSDVQERAGGASAPDSGCWALFVSNLRTGIHQGHDSYKLHRKMRRRG